GAGWIVGWFVAGVERAVGGLAVYAVDEQVAAVVQFVCQPLPDHAADNGAAVGAWLEHRQLARLAAHGPLHGADDVAALTQGAQGLFRLGMAGPRAGPRLVGHAQALPALQAAGQPQAWAPPAAFVAPFGMHQAIVAGLALQCAIQARPPLLLHLALQGLLDLQLGARPQPFSRQFGGAVAEAIGDVVARDDEVFARVITPAHDYV